ncbi:MAG: hypothetical protein K5978_03170 [Campylobacter sp.]|nr:hypothetical protein [Campylobacter sp.]
MKDSDFDTLRTEQYYLEHLDEAKSVWKKYRKLSPTNATGEQRNNCYHAEMALNELDLKKALNDMLKK